MTAKRRGGSAPPRPSRSAARIDFVALAAAALSHAERLVSEWLPGGKRSGHEYTGAPTSKGGAGNSWSVNLRTGAWAHFAGGEAGGDLISLLAALCRISQAKAARAIATSLGIDFPGMDQPARSSERSRAKVIAKRDADGEQPAYNREVVAAAVAAGPVDPLPADAWSDAGIWPSDGPPAPVAHRYRGKPTQSWTYRNAAGAILGLVHRFSKSDGGKEILPCVWSQHPTQGLAWKWRAFTAPRPLYGLDRLAGQPQARVLLVEGEKCADAAQSLLGDKLVAVTWPGGCKAWRKADWQPLAGRKVMLWPDVDAKRTRDGSALLPAEQQPGMSAMHGIAQHLFTLGCDVRMVQTPAPGEVADGFDVADLIAQSGDAPRRETLLWLGRLQAVAQIASVSSLQKNGSGAALATVENANQVLPDAAPAPWRSELNWDRGKLTKHAANITLILGNDARWSGVVAFDELLGATVKRKPPPYEWGRAGEWEAEDDTRTSIWLARQYRLEVPSAMVSEAIESLARQRRFNPIAERIEPLRGTWDGERRNENWLIRHAHAVDTAYVRTVGRLFMRGMVRRALQPGCKFDYCLVLEGAEGMRKSTMAEVLGGDYATDVPLDLSNNKEASIAIRGKWVVEFAEMESVTRVEAHLQKSFLSRRIDQYRELWSKRNIRVPRQCVFIGTTNETEYIKEGQGARRFWPVSVGGLIDIETLRDELPQMLAEALADFDAGSPCHPSVEEQEDLFGPQQRMRVQQESLIDALHDWVLHPNSEEESHRFTQDGMFSLADACYRCLKISYAQLTRDLQTRVGKALVALGSERVEKRNGMTRYWYKPPQKAARYGIQQPAQQPTGPDDDIPF